MRSLRDEKVFRQGKAGGSSLMRSEITVAGDSAQQASEAMSPLLEEDLSYL